MTPLFCEREARKPQWSNDTRNGFLGSLQTAFRWAVKARLIPHTPLTGMERPAKRSRGASALVSADELKKIVAVADPLFGDYLRMLWLTGARPSEIAGLRAEEIDLGKGLVILTEHKNKHKGKTRIIFLSPEAIAIVKSMDRKSGLLFPARDGRPMTHGAIGHLLARLCVKAGIRNCIAYGFRHSFATDALERGVPDAQVAALLGNSPATLHRHYSHVGARAQALREALGRVR